MENDKLQLSNKLYEDGECLLVLELAEEDPLFEKKKKLLEDKGFDAQGHVSLKNLYCPDWPSGMLEILLQRARIICSDEVELYFGGDDVNCFVGFCNPRIELDALHSILSCIDKTLSSGNHMMKDILKDLRNSTINTIQELGNKVGLKSRIVTDYINDKEKCLLHWGESNGVQMKLEVSYVDGAGRGAIAKEDLKVGDVALEIPVSVIISEELVHQSNMFPILDGIGDISSETMLLLWSMKEKHDHNSKFKFYFDTLPELFNTGLSFGIDAIMALDGTLLLEEIVRAKEHLRTQYDELFPALCDDHPDIFPIELYTWEHFLWACELWYSNGMKIMFTDGKLKTCLVPIAGFLNHSLCPHILHYGKVDSATNSLKFPVSRPCNAGEQCCLSYGKFSSSHLVTFYGFLPQGDNPYDVITLDLDAPEAGCSKNGCSLSNWTNHMVRGTWLSKNHGIFHYGLPRPLLDHFRMARCPACQANIHTQEKMEIEMEVLEDLRSTFEDMMETLDDDTTNTDNSPNSTSWDVKLAMEFKEVQKRIVSSIISSCYSGCKLLEYESNKGRA